MPKEEGTSENSRGEMEGSGDDSEELKEIREHNRKMLQDAAHAAALRKGLSTQGEAGKV